MLDSEATFKNGTVMITGAARGIGREIALEFARSTSFELILLSRTEQDLRMTEQDCRDAGAKNVRIATLDITNPESLNNFAQNLNIAFLAGIIHNAGLYAPKKMSETDKTDIEKHLNLNLYAAFELNKIYLKKMISQKRGFLFHIGSLAAWQGLERAPAYAISKHALLGYVRSLRNDLMDKNIAVSILHPGNTWSTSWKGSGVPPERLVNPQDIAKMLVTMAGFNPSSVAEEIVIHPQQGNL